MHPDNSVPHDCDGIQADEAQTRWWSKPPRSFGCVHVLDGEDGLVGDGDRSENERSDLSWQ